MTAREIILQYNKEYSVNNELLNAVKTLVSEKCKEQRGLDSEVIQKHYLLGLLDVIERYDLDTLISDVKNNKQPDVFGEEGKNGN